jgi:glycosyltransferase involved in cell wall biosynthesis
VSRLHVLHVIDSLGLGGAERMAVDLANETARRGHRVTVCVTRPIDTLASELLPAIEVLRLARRWRYELAPIVRLLRHARRERVEIIHVHMRSSMALLLPFRAVGVLAVPVVFHDHYGTIEDDTSVPLWFRLGHRWIDFYVGVSPSLARWARANGLPDERVAVIENALDLSRLASSHPIDLRRELKLSNQVRLALIVATVRKDKGLETALEAIAHTRHDNGIHLAIAGALAEPDYLAMLRARCLELGLQGHVSFLGARRDVPALLRACDFAISSSHTESGPLVLIEFVFAGLPFVATRVGDIGRRLADAGLPGFVPPRDPLALASAIDELLDLAPRSLAERGELGRRFVHGFDIRDVVPRWLEVYDRAKRPA